MTPKNNCILCHMRKRFLKILFLSLILSPVYPVVAEDGPPTDTPTGYPDYYYIRPTPPTSTAPTPTPPIPVAIWDSVYAVAAAGSVALSAYATFKLNEFTRKQQEKSEESKQKNRRINLMRRNLLIKESPLRKK